MTRIRNQTMPPSGNAKLNDKEMKIISTWISQVQTSREKIAQKRTPISRDDLLVAMHDDLDQLSREERLRTRYFTIHNLYNAGECHTPRNPLGDLDKSRALGGAKAPEGKGFIPNITPHKTGLKSWTLKDIAYSLESGFTPEFDTFDGAMAEVQTNTAQMTPQDRLAIAAYLKYIKPVERKKKPKKKQGDQSTTN